MPCDCPVRSMAPSSLLSCRILSRGARVGRSVEDQEGVGGLRRSLRVRSDRAPRFLATAVGYAKSLKSLSFSGADQNPLVLTKKKYNKIITIILVISRRLWKCIRWAQAWRQVRCTGQARAGATRGANRPSLCALAESGTRGETGNRTWRHTVASHDPVTGLLSRAARRQALSVEVRKHQAMNSAKRAGKEWILPSEEAFSSMPPSPVPLPDQDLTESDIADRGVRGPAAGG